MPQTDDGGRTDGRTTDEFRFHELCWHSQAELKNGGHQNNFYTWRFRASVSVSHRSYEIFFYTERVMSLPRNGNDISKTSLWKTAKYSLFTVYLEHGMLMFFIGFDHILKWESNLSTLKYNRINIFHCLPPPANDFRKKGRSVGKCPARFPNY